MTGVDRAAGTIKVSRKALMDKADANADNLIATPPDEDEAAIVAVPKFPVVPPRTFSQEYFL